jgi:cysteine desulfurase
MIYLDWNATTPPLPEVGDAMRAALLDGWANPASVHEQGRRARRHVESARLEVGRLLELEPRDVVLTSGGTEANNLALRGTFPDRRGVLVTSRIEHPSVVRTAELLAEEGVEIEWLPMGSEGAVDPDDLERVLSSRGDAVRLVSVQAVNHETGVLQPIASIAERCASRGVLLHCDAVQAAGRLPSSSWAGADLVSVAAHKLRGPKGVGALATKCGVRLRAVTGGGSQEKGLRPGTQDPVACAGFAAAIRRARDGGHERYARVSSLRDRLEQALLGLRSPGGEVPTRNGGSARAPHIVNLSFPGWRGAELAAALDLEGVAVSSGSACSAGTASPSLVVRAMVGDERARQAVRISLGESTTPSEVERAIAAFERVLRRGRA